MNKINKSLKQIRKTTKNKTKKGQKRIHLGGAYPFKNTISLTVMAKITGDTLDKVNERRVHLGLNPKDNLHITLLKMLVNQDSKIMMSNKKKFQHVIKNLKHLTDSICKIYKTVYLKHNIKFISRKFDKKKKVIGGLWEILGGRGKTLQEKFNNKYFARVFNVPPNARHFTKFLWNYMKKIYDVNENDYKMERLGFGKDWDRFKVFKKNGESLYALDEFYGDFKNWKPHISVLSFHELKNNPLYKKLFAIEKLKLDKNSKQQMQIKLLKDKIGPVEPFSEIQSIHDLKTAFIGLKRYNDSHDIHCTF